MGEIGTPRGRMGLSFKTETDFVRPFWPGEAGQQQMMIHLDIAAEDLSTLTPDAVNAYQAKFNSLVRH